MSLILDGTTGVTVEAGTAAFPAIVSTTGTADTGLWFPAADTVAASTGNTEHTQDDGEVVTAAMGMNGNTWEVSESIDDIAALSCR